ncbi:hypothetical protein D3C84_620720 [compost metagenome]
MLQYRLEAQVVIRWKIIQFGRRVRSQCNRRRRRALWFIQTWIESTVEVIGHRWRRDRTLWLIQTRIEGTVDVIGHRWRRNRTLWLIQTQIEGTVKVIGHRWRRNRTLRLIQTQVEGTVEVIGHFWRLRVVQQQLPDVLRVQLGSHGGSGDTADGHGREAVLQLFDPGKVLAVGHQLAFLGDKGGTVALLAVDFHQLQAQVTALRFELDAVFKQRGSLVQATGGIMRMRLAQYIVIVAIDGGRYQRRGNRRRDHDRNNQRSGCRLWHWRWHRCRGRRWRGIELHARRWHFQAFEAVFQLILFGRILLLFGQFPGHAHVFLGFLLSFAATRQQ